MQGAKLPGLKLARTSMGYNRRQLANLMFVDMTTICCWERCKYSPTPFEIAKLSDILFTSTTFLMNGTYKF